MTRGNRPLSPAAINRPLALLRHLLALARDDWDALPAVPKIRLEREPQGRLRWLTPDEAAGLLEACRAQKNPRLADLAELALYTGMRKGELLGLPWAAVERASGVIRVEQTKSGKRRVVPLNGLADAILARLGSGEGLVFGTRSWDAFRGHWERRGRGDRPRGCPLPRSAAHIRLVGHATGGDPARAQGSTRAQFLGNGDAIRPPGPRAPTDRGSATRPRDEAGRRERKGSARAITGSRDDGLARDNYP